MLLATVSTGRGRSLNLYFQSRMCILLWYNQDIILFISCTRAQACVMPYSFWGEDSWNLEVFHPGYFFYVTMLDWYPPCFHSTLPLQAKTAAASSTAVPAREV